MQDYKHSAESWSRTFFKDHWRLVRRVRPGTAATAVRKSPARKLEPHLAVALGIVGPVLAHLDEQEEVDLGLGDLGDVAAGRLADRLDGLAALAQDDLPLALALDEDRLLDAHRAVVARLPLVGLDRRAVGQLLVQPLVDLLARDLGREHPQGA